MDSAKIKVLINATTCVVGGGVQVAASFISQAMQDNKDSIDFFYAVSPQVMQNVSLDKRPHNLQVISPSPAQLWRGRSARKELAAVESKYNPDIILSIFGPAYHRFTAPHICGFADAWVTHRSRTAMSILSPIRHLYILAKCQYKKWRLSKQDYYWVEADVAHRGLVRLLGIPPTKIKVIPNSYADYFEKPLIGEINKSKNNIVRIFCLAAPYPHKNLKIIPDVASLLRENDPDRVYCFIVTLPDDGPVVRKFWAMVDKYGVKNMIENAGRIKLQECPRFYASSDIVFLPTLLETFSATYPEAMVMGKPIVTTDLDFAHNICGDAAAYYSPMSAEAAAKVLGQVARDPRLRESLIANGHNRLKYFPSPKQKYRLMLQWIQEVADRERKSI